MPILMAEGWTTRFGSMSEKLFLATTLTIVGVAIVFIALVIIIFCIKVMSASIKKLSAKIDAAAIIEIPDVVPPAVPVTNAVSAFKDTEDHDMIIAVIIAAITAARASDSITAPYPGFRVRSIRRV